jgi:hypothetical protein
MQAITTEMNVIANINPSVDFDRINAANEYPNIKNQATPPNSKNELRIGLKSSQ